MSMEGSEQKRSTVKLSFENHTRCECVGRNSDLMPRTEEVIRGPRGHRLTFVSIPIRLSNRKIINSSSDWIVVWGCVWIDFKMTEICLSMAGWKASVKGQVLPDQWRLPGRE